MQEQNLKFLKEILSEQYEEKIVENIIKGYDLKKPVTLRVNTIKTTVDNVKEELIKDGIEYEEVNWYKEALIIRNVKEDEIKKLKIYENGDIYLQSLSSMLPPIMLNPKEGENVLDMTAAPGGKTTQMAVITHNKAFITACEKNKIRAERLKYNLQKQGAGCVNVMTEDARRLSDFFSFDKILLDAPCSGSGTKNVFEERFSKELIKKSSNVQEALLQKALKILKPGGEMIYSTCSILKQENEDILKKVLMKSNARIEPIEPIIEIPTLPVNIEGTVCVCPTDLYEGFFVAKIQK